MDILNEFDFEYDEPPDPRCDQCTQYWFIDSGYGFCRRYPPRVDKVGLFRSKFAIHYPCVPWLYPACGEFKRKSLEVVSRTRTDT